MTIYEREMSVDAFMNGSAKAEDERLNEIIKGKTIVATYRPSDMEYDRKSVRFCLNVLTSILSFISAGAWIFSAFQVTPLDHPKIIASISATFVALVLIWRE